MLKSAADRVLQVVHEKKANSALATYQAAQNTTPQADAKKQMLNLLLLSLGVGAGARGLTGLSQMAAPPVRIPSGVASGTVEMPVLVRKKKPPAIKAANGPTETSGLPWYMPGMLLAGSLGTYGGWKGVDTLLDQHRQKQTQQELEEAKNEYAQALRGAYATKLGSEKTAADLLSEELDLLFDALEKAADAEPGLLSKAKGAVGVTFDGLKGILPGLDAAAPAKPTSTWASQLNQWFDSQFPNLKGQATNAAALYALPAAAGGYMAVDGLMAQNSKHKLLQRALEERERRQIERRPSELYAVPISEDEVNEE